MRFVFLVAGATVVGALSAVAIQTVFPQSTQAFQTMLAGGGGSADFKIGEINPIKRVYQYVVQQVTSGRPSVSLPQASSAWPSIGSTNLGSGLKFDDREMRRFTGAGIARQTQQFNQRMEDLRNYGRNPAGWHGAPPH